MNSQFRIVPSNFSRKNEVVQLLLYLKSKSMTIQVEKERLKSHSRLISGVKRLEEIIKNSLKHTVSRARVTAEVYCAKVHHPEFSICWNKNQRLPEHKSKRLEVLRFKLMRLASFTPIWVSLVDLPWLLRLLTRNRKSEKCSQQKIQTLARYGINMRYKGAWVDKPKKLLIKSNTYAHRQCEGFIERKQASIVYDSVLKTINLGLKVSSQTLGKFQKSS